MSRKNLEQRVEWHRLALNESWIDVSKEKEKKKKEKQNDDVNKKIYSKHN